MLLMEELNEPSTRPIVVTPEIQPEKPKAEKEEAPKPIPKNKEKVSGRKSLIFTETFDDIIGAERAKELLRLYVGIALSDKELLETYGLKSGLGLILFGPPGTGKTALIRALSGEYQIPIIIGEISKIISSYWGDSPKIISELFQKAAKNRPCVLFIDEFDSIGAKRDTGGEGESHKIVQDAVNQLETEMDGIHKRAEDVFIIGATNRPWAIETALKRAGRFETTCYVPPPNYSERMQLFKYYLKDIKEGFVNVNTERLSRATYGFTGADIMSICRNAKARAVERAKRTGKKPKIITGTILTILTDKEIGRSSIEEWYNDVYKEVLPKMNAEDYQVYRTLMDEIKDKKGRKGKILNLLRLFSLYLF